MENIKLNIQWKNNQACSDVDFPHKKKLLDLVTVLVRYLQQEASVDASIFLSKKRHSEEYAVIRHVVLYTLWRMLVRDRGELNAYGFKVTQQKIAAIFSRDHSTLYYARNILQDVQVTSARQYGIHRDAFEAYHESIEEIVEKWLDDIASTVSLEITKQELEKFLQANGGDTKNITWTSPLDIFSEE